MDARRQQAITTAPQVLYNSKEAPGELKNLINSNDFKDTGFVTFGISNFKLIFLVIEPRHYSTPDKAYKLIDMIISFRNYLHYHIKCSKAYMHSRMRHRVSEFQKVLNRAKTEVAVERKTIRLVSCLLFPFRR